MNLKISFFVLVAAVIFPINTLIAIGEVNQSHRSQLLAALSQLGEKITKQEKHMREIENEAKLCVLGRVEGSENEERIKRLQAIDENGNAFLAKIINAFHKKDLVGFLQKELFEDYELTIFMRFNTVKLCFVRLIVEMETLKDLITEYENMLQRVAELEA